MPDWPALRLDQPAELVGEWWLPYDEERTTPGRLTYEPHERLRLELFGGHVLEIQNAQPIMLGMTVEGQLVTLRDCQATNYRSSMPGGVRTEAIVGTAFVGMHARREQQIRLHSLRAQATHLTEWLGTTAIDLSHAVFPSGGTMSFGAPNGIILARPAGALVYTKFNMAGDSDGRLHAHRVSLEQESWLTVEPTRRRHFDWLRDRLFRLHDFLAFAVGAEIQFTEIRGEATITVRTFGPSGFEHDQRADVWVLFRQRRPADSVTRKRSEMLLRHEDTMFENNRPLTRWLRRAALLEPASNLYLVAQPRSGLYLEFRFLALAQALETLHARLYSRPKDVNFRKRIQRHVDDLPSKVRDLVPARFVPLVVDTRNYFTHWDAKLEKRAAKGDDLFAVTEALKLLFECAMLRALGFSKTDSWRLMRENSRLSGNFQMSFTSL